MKRATKYGEIIDNRYAVFGREYANYLAWHMREITGDDVRLIQIGRAYFEIHRWTGTEWVKS